MKRKFLHLIILLALLSLFFLLIRNNTLYDDEFGHFDQIRLFLKHRWQIYQGISLIPGYHLFVASIGLLFKQTSVPQLRTISFFFSLVSVIIFFFLAERIDETSSLIKTIQLAFLPILFPYLFLLYNESLSILLTVCAFTLAVYKKNFLAGLFSIFSILARQTNIIWLAFIYFYICRQNFRGKFDRKFRQCCLKNNWIYPFGIILFSAFVIFNRGFAIGTQTMHPNFNLRPGNIYWALFLYFLLFLPFQFGKIPRIYHFIRKNKKILLPTIMFFIIGVYTFRVDHPWNQYSEHLRNLLLLFFTSNIFTKGIFFIIIIYSLFSLFLTKLNRPIFLWLYPFAAFSLAPIWLIESRYSLIFFIFFNLFRKTLGKKWEYLLTIYFIILSSYFFYGYLHQLFYL